MWSVCLPMNRVQSSADRSSMAESVTTRALEAPMNKLLSKLREKRATGDKGFTLIELLVVVVIISVLKLCANDNGGKYPDNDKMSLQNGGGDAGSCNRPIALSDGTTLYYRTSDKGVSYVITDTNDSGSGKVYCYNSAKGGQVQETGTGLGAQECKQ